MSLDITTLRRRLQEALGDEFTVGDLLGEGGFAAVFRVRDNQRRRDVAVKVLDLGLTPSPSLAERFVREAHTVARLEHPHIVPIYKVGGYNNQVLYIVMRYVDGPSLRQLLEKRRRLSPADAARIGRQVADALGHAHRHHLVHRDVKPDNILLDSSGHVLVTDFGIAKAAQEASTQLTTEGMVVGTPQYMSPEQALGDRIDNRSDVYALGIVLYHMLTGAPPFDGESAQQILMKQATAEPTPILELRGDLPPALAAVVHRLLAKDPAERYETAQAVSRALVEALPTAARERIKVSGSPLAATIQGLVGVGVVAALAVVAIVVFSRQPLVSASAPIPDSLAQALWRRGALAAGEAAQYVYVPGGGEDTTLLVVGQHSVAVVTPRRVRAYPRDSATAAYGIAPGIGRRAGGGGGLRFRLVLSLPRARRDTVFRSLSFREIYELAPRLRKLLGDETKRGAVRSVP